MQSSDTLRTDFDTWKTQLDKHKKECGVAEINTPGTTKDSREALHDTSNATDPTNGWGTFWKDALSEQKVSVAKTKTKQKIVDDFLDTICCALEEMSGKEVFDCFVEAIQSQHEYTKKEYYKTIDLMDLLSVL
jgi:hypothetical protein